MIKQIPKYGAVILTAMVIVRAATLEEEGDISGLYQRDFDRAYVSDNSALRANFNFPNTEPTVFLASVLKKPAEEMPIVVHKAVQSYTPVEEITLTDNLVTNLDGEIAEILEEATLDVETFGLSLDRESTINTRLSVQFPRQRIEPKPSPSSLQE